MGEKGKGPAAAIGLGVGLGTGVLLGKATAARAAPANEKEALAAILDDTYAIKTGMDNLALVLSEFVKVLSPKPPAFPGMPPYNVVKLLLDTARPPNNLEEINLPGDTMTFYTDGTLEGVFIRFDSPTNDPVPIAEFGNPYHYWANFQKFYVQSTSQPGRYLRIHVGRDAGAEAGVELTASYPKPVFYTAFSDKDTHFTDLIIPNAKEDENIPGLLANKIRIVGLVILADQQLHWRVAFWRRNTFENADLDVDTFITAEELDLPVDGWQIAGAGKWYLSLTSLNADYEDEGKTNQLHISIQNLSAVNKVAGAAGEVVIGVIYEPRA